MCKMLKSEKLFDIIALKLHRYKHALLAEETTATLKSLCLNSRTRLDRERSCGSPNLRLIHIGIIPVAGKNQASYKFVDT